MPAAGSYQYHFVMGLRQIHALAIRAGVSAGRRWRRRQVPAEINRLRHEKLNKRAKSSPLGVLTAGSGHSTVDNDPVYTTHQVLLHMLVLDELMKPEFRDEFYAVLEQLEEDIKKSKTSGGVFMPLVMKATIMHPGWCQMIRRVAPNAWDSVQKALKTPENDRKIRDAIRKVHLDIESASGRRRSRLERLAGALFNTDQREKMRVLLLAQERFPDMLGSRSFTDVVKLSWDRIKKVRFSSAVFVGSTIGISGFAWLFSAPAAGWIAALRGAQLTHSMIGSLRNFESIDNFLGKLDSYVSSFIENRPLLRKMKNRVDAVAFWARDAAAKYLAGQFVRGSLVVGALTLFAASSIVGIDVAQLADKSMAWFAQQDWSSTQAFLDTVATTSSDLSEGMKSALVETLADTGLLGVPPETIEAADNGYTLSKQGLKEMYSNLAAQGVAAAKECLAGIKGYWGDKVFLRLFSMPNSPKDFLLASLTIASTLALASNNAREHLAGASTIKRSAIRSFDKKSNLGGRIEYWYFHRDKAKDHSIRTRQSMLKHRIPGSRKSQRDYQVDLLALDFQQRIDFIKAEQELLSRQAEETVADVIRRVHQHDQALSQARRFDATQHQRSLLHHAARMIRQHNEAVLGVISQEEAKSIVKRINKEVDNDQIEAIIQEAEKSIRESRESKQQRPKYIEQEMNMILASHGVSSYLGNGVVGAWVLETASTEEAVDVNPQKANKKATLVERVEQRLGNRNKLWEAMQEVRRRRQDEETSLSAPGFF